MGNLYAVYRITFLCSCKFPVNFDHAMEVDVVVESGRVRAVAGYVTAFSNYAIRCRVI